MTTLVLENLAALPDCAKRLRMLLVNLGRAIDALKRNRHASATGAVRRCFCTVIMFLKAQISDWTLPS